jgi:hypothetical protein
MTAVDEDKILPRNPCRIRGAGDEGAAEMIYQHEARGADTTITSAIDTHIVAEQGKDDDDDGSAGARPGRLIAR